MKLSSFCENDKVLLLGEGNFSFAVSLVEHNLNITITASCYESSIGQDSTRNNVDFLRTHGICVLLGVDATKLAEHPSLRSESFDKIVFNFPHVGGKMRLDKNRALLKEFFLSARQCLKPDGSILMTLCNGQGGTFTDKPQRRWDDSWKVKEMAAHGNFILKLVEPFQKKNFETYNSTGYRGLEKEFNVQNSLTHIFAKVECPTLQDFAPKDKFDIAQLGIAGENISYVDIMLNSGTDLSNQDLPVFAFDVTFSFDKDFRESTLYTILYNSMGKIVRNVQFVRSYEFPSGKIAKTYRISYQSNDLPLYRRRVVDLHRHAVAKILEDNMNVIVTM